MSAVPPRPEDDPLARAEAALRRLPVPPGPDPDTVARTLAALADAQHREAVTVRRRRVMALSLKIAAAVLAAVGLLAYFAAPRAAALGPFTEAAHRLRDAHTLTWTQTLHVQGLDKPMTQRVSFKEPSLFRNEAPGGLVVIVDGARGKQLILNPASKSALLLEPKAGAAPAAAPPGAADQPSLVDGLRKLTEGDARALGEKEIDGARALGYAVTRLGQEMTVWVHPQTRLPVRIEAVTRSQGKEIRTVLTDLRIDPPLDDVLFRLDPPEGYTLQKAKTDASETDEKTFLDPARAAVALLRPYAEKTGGTFPKTLKDLKEFDRLFPTKLTPGGLPDAESLTAVQAMTRFLMATRPLKDGFGYRSEGVRLGDADKVLFWFKPAGAADYRAVFGDLHIATVPADKLPAAPQP